MEVLPRTPRTRDRFKAFIGSARLRPSHTPKRTHRTSADHVHTFDKPHAPSTRSSITARVPNLTSDSLKEPSEIEDAPSKTPTSAYDRSSSNSLFSPSYNSQLGLTVQKVEVPRSSGGDNVPSASTNDRPLPGEEEESGLVGNAWSTALSLLPEKERLYLHNHVAAPTNKNSGMDLLGQINEAICSKRKECEQKRTKITIKEKEFVLRDTADCALRWIDKFKQAGDLVTAIDPGHVTLPWIIIRTFLQVASASRDQMGALLVGSERIAFIAARCRLYEMFMNSTESTKLLNESTSNFKRALVKLFELVLRFMSRAIQLFDMNGLTRAVNALFNPEIVLEFCDQAQPLLNEVQTAFENHYRVHCHEWQQALREKAATLKELIDDMHAPLNRIDLNVSRIEQSISAADRIKILQWMSTVEYDRAHSSAKAGRTPGTGGWFLKHLKYQRWRQSEVSMLLWLHGIPGAGKTKLASIAVDDALSHTLDDEALAYFYCNRNETERNEPAAVLRSFVRQVSLSRTSLVLHPTAVETYKRHEATGLSAGLLDVEQCLKLLLEYASIYPQTTLILDALDECDAGRRHNLIQCLNTLLKVAPNPVKILVSSRADEDIRSQFSSGLRVEIQAKYNSDDIAKYVEERIEKNVQWQQKISANTKTLVKERLHEKSDGMFQWAALQVDQLFQLKFERDVKERLGKLPDSLTKAYEELYSQICGEPGSTALIVDRAFQWIMGSCRPLNASTLVAAVCQDSDSSDLSPVDVDIDSLLAACRNLLVVEPTTGYCRFCHLSVQEYFESKWQPKKTKSRVAKVCLNVLLDPTLSTTQSTCTELFPCEICGPFSVRHSHEKYRPSDARHSEIEALKPLLSYAHRFWYLHCNEECGYDLEEDLFNLIMSFFGKPNEPSAAYIRWRDARCCFLEKSELIELKYSPVFGICCLGFPSVLNYCLAAGFRFINQRSDSGLPLLAAALAAGHSDTATLLIKSGADVNIIWDEEVVNLNKDGTLSTPKSCHVVPITIVIRAGDTAMAQLLLQYGADTTKIIWSEDLLNCAFTNVDIFRALLIAGLDDLALSMLVSEAVYQLPYASDTHTTSASETPAMEILRLLLAAGADPNEPDHTGTYPLGRALTERQLEGLQLLLRAGARWPRPDDGPSEEDWGYYLYSAVADKDRNSLILATLSAYGCSMDVKDVNGMTALHWAAQESHWVAADMLLELDTDPNVYNNEGHTPLSIALTQQRHFIVELLLGAGADPCGEYSDGMTMLHKLATCDTVQREGLAQVLDDCRVDIDRQDVHGMTALHYAVCENNIKYAKQLLNAGIDFTLQNIDGQSSLNIALQKGYSEMEELLRSWGAQTDSTQRPKRFIRRQNKTLQYELIRSWEAQIEYTRPKRFVWRRDMNLRYESGGADYAVEYMSSDENLSILSREDERISIHESEESDDTHDDSSILLISEDESESKVIPADVPVPVPENNVGLVSTPKRP